MKVWPKRKYGWIGHALRRDIIRSQVIRWKNGAHKGYYGTRPRGTLKNYLEKKQFKGNQKDVNSWNEKNCRGSFRMERLRKQSLIHWIVTIVTRPCFEVFVDLNPLSNSWILYSLHPYISRRKKLRLLGNVSQKQNKLNKTQYISAYKAIIRSTMAISQELCGCTYRNEPVNMTFQLIYSWIRLLYL
jgi:hypothetical protein